MIVTLADVQLANNPQPVSATRRKASPKLVSSVSSVRARWRPRCVLVRHGLPPVSGGEASQTALSDSRKDGGPQDRHHSPARMGCPAVATAPGSRGDRTPARTTHGRTKGRHHAHRPPDVRRFAARARLCSSSPVAVCGWRVTRRRRIWSWPCRGV
jgi:hypothetical protein